MDEIHRALVQTYWSPNIRREVVETAFQNSLCIGAYNPSQVAFARVITDRATFAWLCDVWVHPDFRGQGIAQSMLGHLFELPELQTLRRWCLATKDAQTLYAKFGFEPVPAERWMHWVRDPSTWSE